jgi:LuxR family maltose regulon positive regulatory protein
MTVRGGPLVLPSHQTPSGRRVVQRRPLFEQLSATPAGGVALVTGPAGSGKTVLVRSWLEAAGLADRAAWVPVDRGERDGQRFWLCVIDALAGAVGADEQMARVSGAPGLRGEVVVEGLLSDLASLEEPVVLVIDDVDELRLPSVTASLELFLARLPAQMRAVLVMRSDGGLGLHRLRVAGRLSEVRARPRCGSRAPRRAICSARPGSTSRMPRWLCFTSAPRAGRRACASR